MTREESELTWSPLPAQDEMGLSCIYYSEIAGAPTPTREYLVYVLLFMYFLYKEQIAFIAPDLTFLCQTYQSLSLTFNRKG